MFDLAGKVAIITGAARGMGEAHARALASQGATVIITDLDPHACQMVADSISAGGHEARAYRLDVTDRDAVRSVFADVVAHCGRIDILVNNAGIYAPKPFLELTHDDWERTLRINLTGQFLCAQEAARDMRTRKSGRIINITSISSGGVGIGVPASVHYTASKGGIIGMTEAMAVELAPEGILVNAIAPGGIDTPMANPEGKSREALSPMMQRAPLKRIGTPQEVSAAVVFLASDEASYVTGTVLYVDGGWLAA